MVNSGADAFGDFEWSSIDYMKKIMDVNVWQVARISKAIIPFLRHYRHGHKNRLVFHSSFLARIMEPGNVPFATSKMALEGICDAIRLECYHQNISGRSF